MRILYLCHRFPYPANKGEKIRAFHQIKALAGKHEVDVFTLSDDLADADYYAELARHCRRLTAVRINPCLNRARAMPFLFTRKPVTLPCFHSRELHSALDEARASRQYDRVFVYCSAMGQYVKPADPVPVIMDFVDVDSDKWLQYAPHAQWPLSAVYRREGHCLREYERSLCQAAACVIVSTGREAELLRRISHAAPVQAIPNGVDAEYFNPGTCPGGQKSPAIVFTGDMSYFPNQEAVAYFARNVFPLVRRSVAHARFVIVGRNPGRAVRELGGIEGIEVTGYVPDVRPYLAKARVAVAPFSIAAGIQNKILEAMAFALPVVATSRAAQGLAPSVRDLVETADTMEDMAASIVRFLSNPDVAERQGLLSRQRIAAEYSWSAAATRLLWVIEHPSDCENLSDRGVEVRSATPLRS